LRGAATDPNADRPEQDRATAGSATAGTVRIMTEPPTLLTIAEAAALLGMSPSTLRDRVTAGTVPHIRLGKVRGVRFTPEHLAEICARGQVPVGTRFPHRAHAQDQDPGEDALARFTGLRSLRAE
jgi:excisionase family DNA binding protein